MSDPIPDLADLPYGPSERHRLDLWLAPGVGEADAEEGTPHGVPPHHPGREARPPAPHYRSDRDAERHDQNGLRGQGGCSSPLRGVGAEPHEASVTRLRPLVVYFHGGGFVHGDKGAYAPRVKRLLAAGISVASVNYRFVANAPDAAPFPAPQEDGVRALQFLREHAGEWGVDPDRFAVVGASAGANLGLWAALQPEQSPWVRCVVSYVGQSTNDPRVIQAEIGESTEAHGSTLVAYGIRSLDELESPATRALIDHVSSLNHVGPTSPPVMMIAASPLSDAPFAEPAEPNYLIHHAMFGELLRRAYEHYGRTCITYHAESPMPPDADLHFLIAHLQP